MNPFKAGDMVVWVDGQWPKLVGHTAKVLRVNARTVYLEWITGPRIGRHLGNEEGWFHYRVRSRRKQARLV